MSHAYTLYCLGSQDDIYIADAVTAVQAMAGIAPGVASIKIPSLDMVAFTAGGYPPSWSGPGVPWTGTADDLVNTLIAKGYAVQWFIGDNGDGVN